MYCVIFTKYFIFCLKLLIDRLLILTRFIPKETTLVNHPNIFQNDICNLKLNTILQYNVSLKIIVFCPSTKCFLCTKCLSITQSYVLLVLQKKFIAQLHRETVAPATPIFWPITYTGKMSKNEF